MKRWLTLLLLVFFVLNAQEVVFGDCNNMMRLPWIDPEVKIQQGWVYENGGSHNGFDLIKGEIDRSSTWVSFDVVSPARGEAKYFPNGSTTYGNYVVTRHWNGKTYCYFYGAHLKGSSISSTEWVPVEAGTKIGDVGTSGWMDCTNPCPHLHGDFYEGTTAKADKIDPFDIQSSIQDLQKRTYYPGGDKYYGIGTNNWWIDNPPRLADGNAWIWAFGGESIVIAPQSSEFTEQELQEIFSDAFVDEALVSSYPFATSNPHAVWGTYVQDFCADNVGMGGVCPSGHNALLMMNPETEEIFPPIHTLHQYPENTTCTKILSVVRFE